MTAIAYERADTKKFKLNVRLDGKIVGAIRQTPSRMFYYQPKRSSETGAVFATLAECKASIATA